MIFRLLRTSRIEFVDVLVLLLGNGIAVSWLYMIAKYGAVFPPVSPVIQVLSASGFELIILFWTLDFLQVLRKEGNWFSFLSFSCLLWLGPLIFTLQILQIQNFWLPIWVYLVGQGVVFTIYILRRWTSFGEVSFWVRGAAFAVLIGAILALNHFSGLMDRVVVNGEKEVAQLKKLANQHARQGTVLYDRGDFVLAKEQFEKAVGLYPRHKVAQASLGFIHSKEGFYDEAVEAFEKLIFVDPSGQNFIKMGQAFWQAEELEEAVKAWDRVPKADPMYTQAQSLIEIARKKEGDKVKQWIGPASEGNP